MYASLCVIVHFFTIIQETRKKCSDKPIVVFTNSTVFILDFYIYKTKPVWSHFGLDCMDFEENSYSHMPGSLNPDYNICMQGKFLTNGAFPPKAYLTV